MNNNGSSKTTNTVPTPRRAQPLRAVNRPKTAPAGVVKTRANQPVVRGNAVGDQGVERILKLVKKGNARGLCVEATVVRMDKKIADMEETIAGLLTAFQRKLV